MNLSPAGLHLIASFEGWVPHWYDDGTGVQTIGFGHTGRLPPGFTPPLSIDEGLAILRADTAATADAVSRAVKVSLGIVPRYRQARFDALVSLTYNIGAGGFESSSLLREINRKGAPRDWTPCLPLILEWDHAGGQVLPGLLRRRQVEGRQLVTGKQQVAA